jgi:hypothetical protein
MPETGEEARMVTGKLDESEAGTHNLVFARFDDPGATNATVQTMLLSRT